MFVNIIRSYRDVVAICDEELLGKKFEEENFQLEVKEAFYSNNKKTPKETLEIMLDMKKEDATFNIVGEESVKLAIEAKIAKKESVKKIGGIPFVLILL